MDFSVKYNCTSLSFNARMSKSDKIKIDKVLSKLMEDDKIDLQSIYEKSGYSENYIFGWFKDKFGMSPMRYFKQKEKQLLIDKFIELYNKGLTVKQLAEYFSRSTVWVNSMKSKLNLEPQLTNTDKSFDIKLSRLLAKGYTLNTIAKKMNCSVTKVQQRLSAISDGSILNYRIQNGIKLNHSSKLKRKIDAIQKHFSEGKGIKETSELVGVSKTSISRLKNSYGVQTPLDRGHELMDIFLPDMVQAHDSLKTMSRFFGLSVATVSRRIKALFGQNYLELLKDDNLK